MDRKLRENMKIILSENMEIIEELADLEHEQWGHWTEYMLDNLTDINIKKWKKQIKTSYSELSEKEKDSDREWAEKVLNIINKYKGEK
jgi:hypothetical protein